MRSVYKAWGLLLLMLVAQQGAVVHELSHLTGADRAELQVASGGAIDAACALCPAFAQVATPAFSHSFHIPLLVRTQILSAREPQRSVVNADVPRPRSRGPPSVG